MRFVVKNYFLTKIWINFQLLQRSSSEKSGSTGYHTDGDSSLSAKFTKRTPVKGSILAKQRDTERPELSCTLLGMEWWQFIAEISKAKRDHFEHKFHITQGVWQIKSELLCCPQSLSKYRQLFLESLYQSRMSYQYVAISLEWLIEFRIIGFEHTFDGILLGKLMNEGNNKCCMSESIYQPLDPGLDLKDENRCNELSRCSKLHCLSDKF